MNKLWILVLATVLLSFSVIAPMDFDSFVLNDLSSSDLFSILDFDIDGTDSAKVNATGSLTVNATSITPLELEIVFLGLSGSNVSAGVKDVAVTVNGSSSNKSCSNSEVYEDGSWKCDSFFDIFIEMPPIDSWSLTNKSGTLKYNQSTQNLTLTVNYPVLFLPHSESGAPEFPESKFVVGLVVLIIIVSTVILTKKSD